ncbi:hypothetical protein B0H34DRAFT_723916 [Crassisporium funariophilum]|nr:hypothetical protein B0H34DRAFT_723846 [Crassisporium funariophilum]KAF8152166.1 hypothetical protein B0H34DRAFT_723916 [Crassisporium funariophilum]
MCFSTPTCSLSLTHPCLFESHFFEVSAARRAQPYPSLKLASSPDNHWIGIGVRREQRSALRPPFPPLNTIFGVPGNTFTPQSFRVAFFQGFGRAASATHRLHQACVSMTRLCIGIWGRKEQRRALRRQHWDISSFLPLCTLRGNVWNSGDC